MKTRDCYDDFLITTASSSFRSCVGDVFKNLFHRRTLRGFYQIRNEVVPPLQLVFHLRPGRVDGFFCDTMVL